ncbi:hypothetical protein Tco_0711564 [Tanacetum coccineum]
MAINSQEVVSKPSSSNNDLNIIDLQKENEELLKFNKDFAKTFEKLLNEKRSLEKENSKLSSKINDLEIEVKKLANDKEVVEPCKTCDVLTKEVDSLKYNVSKLQDEALNFSKFKSSSIALDDMLSRQKLSQDKEGLGFSKNDKTSSANDWIVDSGCTKHMTGNRRLFTLYKAYDGGHVIFRSNLKGKVVGGVNITHDSITITNVEHVSGLAFNLISVVIMKYLVNISKRCAFWSLNEDILKITILTTNMPKHFKTLSLDELRSSDFKLFSDQEYSEEEVAETMAETIKQYMSKTRTDYGSGVSRPKIKDKDNCELKGQFLKELRINTFSSLDHEDANEHIEYFSFGRHLEELHVTWAHLEKKRTRLRTYTNIDQEFLYSGWRRRHKYNVTPSP